MNLTTFNRRFLAAVHDDVRKALPLAYSGLHLFRLCGVTKSFRDNWSGEIVIPNLNRFTWSGRAADAYHARAQTWQAWLNAKESPQ